MSIFISVALLLSMKELLKPLRGVNKGPKYSLILARNFSVNFSHTIFHAKLSWQVSHITAQADYPLFLWPWYGNLSIDI